MLKKYSVVLLLLVAVKSFSQGSHGGVMHLEGFSVKTDVLSLFNSAIGPNKDYSLSGELYFNNEYSFVIDLHSASEDRAGLSRVQKRITSQFRWYFEQEQCSCSAFCGGVYFSRVRMRQSVDYRKLHTHAVDFTRYSYEVGLYGGYQALFNEHFLLDPGVQIGKEFYHKIQSTESINTFSEDQGNGVLFRIQVGIGYRF